LTNAANIAFLCVKNGNKYQWKMLNHNKRIYIRPMTFKTFIKILKSLYLNDGHQIVSFVRQNSSHGCDYLHTKHVEAF